MTKTPPNWTIWLKMPTLEDARQAVALTYGYDPASFKYGAKGSLHAESSIGGFGDRLMLYRTCHKKPISPAQLSE